MDFLLPWDFLLGPGSAVRQGMPGCDAIGVVGPHDLISPYFALRFAPSASGGPPAPAAGGLIAKICCFSFFSWGRAASDACTLASCNKATAGALVTCSLLCCQAADMPLLAAGPGVLPAAAAAPARPGRSPCASAALAGVFSGRARRCLLPHALCGWGPFNCSWLRLCLLCCPPRSPRRGVAVMPELVLGVLHCRGAVSPPQHPCFMALLLPSIWGAEPHGWAWQSQPSCCRGLRLSPAAPRCATHLEFVGGDLCNMCLAQAV